MKFPLSVVILARNEAANIEQCVQAVQWCSDVVVIDDGSTDATVSVAERCGARVVQHAFRSFADQRNWAMTHADLQNEWVLHLDADEVVTPELRTELESQLPIVERDVVGFRMCRKLMFFGHWLKYSDGFPVWIMRLVRKGRAAFEDSGHGEVAVPKVHGQMETIRQPFLHYAFSKGLDDWIARHNRYSRREAILESESLSKFSLLELFSPDRAARRLALRKLSRKLPFRGFLRFVYQYILKRGFLDGAAGLHFCRLMATYESWIVLKRKEIESRPGALPEPKIEVIQDGVGGHSGHVGIPTPGHDKP
jgi:glycosyltransferase involved in cell wall biosynthesis